MRLGKGMWIAAAAAAVALVVAGAATSGSPGKYGENYNAKPALLLKAFGTTKDIPQPLLASVYRAGQPVTGAKLDMLMVVRQE